MGGIIGGGSNAKQQKAVGSLQFQSSQHGGVIPLVYGTTRVSPNLSDYDDFKATPSSRQGGGARGVAAVRGVVSNINQCLGYYGCVSRADCWYWHCVVGQECRNALHSSGLGLSRKRWAGSGRILADEPSRQGSRIFWNRNCSRQQLRYGRHRDSPEFFV